MSDVTSGPNRPVQETPRSDQQSLFAQSPEPPGEGEASSKSGELHFVERTPEEITIGGVPLGTYLKERDQEWILAVRERLRAVDWGSWEAKYEGGGRPPYHPAPMAALVIYGVMEGKSSLRELEDVAKTDLRCMWLTGGIQPDHSTIGRYICRHAQQFEGEGFLELTETILEVMPEVDGEVAGDGTILEAFASKLNHLKADAAEQWAQETVDQESSFRSKAASGGEGEAKGSQESTQGERGESKEESGEERRAKKLLEIIKNRLEERAHHGGEGNPTKFSRTEPEAVWHKHKDGSYGFGYVSSVIANRQRFIVGQAVDRTNEKAVVGQLLDQAESLLDDGEQKREGLERLSLDNNYYTLSILEEVLERELDTLIYPDQWESEQTDERPKRGGKFAKQAFEYNPEQDVYICPAGEQLEWIRSGTDRNGRNHDSYGRSPACEDCPLREDCTDSKEGRTVKRYEKDELKEAMRKVMAQPRAQQAYSRRMGTVEPVFAAIRRRGFTRSRRRGLDGASIEMALQSIGHNFDRFRSYLTTGQLKIGGLGTETGSYTGDSKCTLGTSFFGRNAGVFRQTGPLRSQIRCPATESQPIPFPQWRPKTRNHVCAERLPTQPMSETAYCG